MQVWEMAFLEYLDQLERMIGRSETRKIGLLLHLYLRVKDELTAVSPG